MKEVLHIIKDNNLIFKSLKELDKKELKIRAKIDFYRGVDQNGYFTVIFKIKRKSRVLQKDVLIYEQLVKNISQKLEHNFKFKLAFINAPLCSKASKLFKEYGWDVYETI